jgi:hypothetical protein
MMSNHYNQIGLNKKESKEQTAGRQRIYADIIHQKEVSRKLAQGGLADYNWPTKHNTSKNKKH